MKNVAASIVIYKHELVDLKPTLDSLLAIDNLDKIYLIDNDNSSWASTISNERIVYIKSPGNVGFGKGHNLAIHKYAKNHDFFLICNPDIEFDVQNFNLLLNFAITRKEGLFLPKILYKNGNNQYGARLLPTPLNLFVRRFFSIYADNLDHKYMLKDFDLQKPIFAPYLHGCFMLFKSEVLLELNGFDERFFMYMEDIDLSRRCAQIYGNIYFPSSYIFHMHEQASYKNSNLLKAHLNSAFKYFNKWGWFLDPVRDNLNHKCLSKIFNNKD